MRRAHRLRRPADFQRVRAMRRSWGHPLLVLYVAPNDGQATRLGISVGKRVGKAVTRNQVKRRVREAVRHRLSVLLPGYDVVFIVRAAAADATWPDLRDAADSLLRRARVLPSPGAPASNDQRGGATPAARAAVTPPSSAATGPATTAHG
ncbi:MAG: ribonuclease P protein component [Chloroflexota bacterium]